jgi:hypothetical protein
MVEPCTPLAGRRSGAAWALLSFAIYGLGIALSGGMVSGFLQVALRIHYGGFGFIKRGLIGSLAQPLLGPAPAYPTLIQAGLLYGLLIGALLSLAFGSLLAASRQPSSRLLFLVSPAALLQLGYTFSWYDGACTLLFLLQLLLLRSRRAWLQRLLAPLLALLAAAAILVHELYLLAFLPLLIWQAWPRLNRPGRGLLLLVVLLSTGALLWQGSYEPGPAELAARLGLDLAHAPLEFTSSLATNLSSVVKGLWLGGYWRGSVPALLYLAVLLGLARRAGSQLPPLLLALSPLLLGLIGVDLPRWCALAATNLLLLGLLGAIRFSKPGTRPWHWLALPFVLAGPIGVFGYSFPLVTPGLSQALKALPQVLR